MRVQPENVLGGVVAFAGLWLLAHLLRALVARILRRRNFRPDLVALVTNILYFGVAGLAIFSGASIVFSQVGIAFNGVLVVALLTGLGLQDLAKNYVSGFFILFERNVRVGDRLETQGLYRGTITDVRLRATYLRGDAGELVVIPNNELFSKPIVVTSSAGTAPASGEGAKHDPAEGVEPISL